MRRVSGLCVLALLVGCGGGSAMKKKPDAGGNDATGTTDVGGTIDRIVEASGGDVASDTGSADVPPDIGPSVGDASPDTSDAAGSDVAAGSDAADGGAADATDDASDATGASDASDVGETAALRLVGFSFTGEVATVARKGGTGLPLGFDGTVRTAAITGSLTYDPKLFDLAIQANRGEFQALVPQATFTLTVMGKTVTGSMRAKLEVEDGTTIDTFRYRDGPQPLDNTLRIMKLDGVDAPNLSLFIAISGGDGTAFTSDKLPDPFPAIDLKKFPHTFTLEDDGGTLLMQLDTLTPQ